MKKWMALLMSVLALGLVAAGCGGDDDEDGDGAATSEQTAPEDTGPADTGTETEAAGGGELELTAPENQITWEPKELRAPAGEVTITLTNRSADIPHNVAIEGPGGDPIAQGPVVTDATSTTRAELDPGEYTYFCAVGNHRQQGMDGTLTVE